MVTRTVCIVCARDEADALEATLAGLDEAFPGARVLVADDGSRDATPRIALEAGAELVRAERRRGKGEAASRAAERVLPLARVADPPVFVLCDGDLGASAARLGPLAEAVRSGGADVAVAVFARRAGGGFGLALGAARRAVRSLCGLELAAPISGQRALAGPVLPLVLPFAPRFGMEIAMTVDAARAGCRVREIELDLAHRATGRTAAGFAHRGRQLADFALVWLGRR